MFGFKRPSLKKRIDVLEKNNLLLNLQIETIIDRLYSALPMYRKMLFPTSVDSKLEMVAQEFKSIEVLRDNFKLLLTTLDLELIREPSIEVIKKKVKK